MLEKMYFLAKKKCIFFYFFSNSFKNRFFALKIAVGNPKTVQFLFKFVRKSKTTWGIYKKTYPIFIASIPT
jgi:hypothetical protein